jgi:hypothetical protein
MTFAAAARRRIQQFGPYKSLAILLVPLLIVEPMKMGELDSSDGPFSIVAPDRAQAVHFVQANALDRTGLSVSENHSFTDKLDMGPF